MANLGTLWFGADIDMSELQRKIQQGNSSILNALKIDYDPASYQQMVSKLQSQLSNETFRIKIDADASQAMQNIKQTLSSPKMSVDFSDISELNRQILYQTEYVEKLRTEVARLNEEYKNTGSSVTKDKLLEKRNQLVMEKESLNNLVALRNAYRNTQQDNILNLRAEAQAAKTAREEQKTLNQERANSLPILRQLRYAVSGLLAVDQLRRIASNIIEIGGQLEKQRVSMGAILGDVAKANVLFERIKRLAVKSPFGVVELDQYTKQLAAYGFEYEEQFDMIKRLADIAAGAGQDISRLTLALGHVKAQTYLTGYVMRQFAMNNIPMMKMLSEYYTEMEGTLVSTAEVQKRISERKVSYEDVIEQIKRLTDAGGMFYNMQEKIAETLAAKWKNLRDQINIMFGEMAEGSVGDALKNVAEMLTNLAKQWETILAILTPTIVAFGAYRVALLAASATQAVASSSLVRFYTLLLATTKATKAQAAAMALMNAAFKANTFGVVLAALTSMFTLHSMLKEKVLSVEEATQKFKERLEETESKINDERLAAERLASTLSNVGKPMEERNAAYEKLNEMYPGILSDMNKENILLLTKAELLERINEASKVKSIDEAQKEYDKAIKDLADKEAAYNTIKDVNYLGQGAEKVWEAQRKAKVEYEAAKQAVVLAKDRLDTLKAAKKVEDDIKSADWNKKSKAIAKGFDELLPEDGEDLFKYIDKVGKRLNELDTKIKNFKPGTDIANDVLPDLEKEKKIAEEIYYNILGQSKNLKGGSEDKALEIARVRLDEVKSYLSEYKKYKEIYGHTEAINLLDKLFPTKGYNGEEIVNNFKEVLLKIKNSLVLDTDDRQKFGLSIDKLIADTSLDKAGEAVDAILNQLENEIKKKGKQWDLYKKILDATGNREQAANLSFGATTTFRNYAEQLRSEIEDALGALPEAKSVGIDKLLGMDDTELKNFGIIEKGVDGIYKKLKKLDEVEQSLSEENIELFIDALKGARDLNGELASIALKYDKIRESIRKNNGGNDLIENANKNQSMEEAKVRWEWFKKSTEGWGEMFSNLDRMTDIALDNMIEKLEEVLPTIQANEQAVRELYDALEKMRGERVNRNPFKGLGNNIKNLSSNDPKVRKSAWVDFIDRLNGISDKFEALEKILNPVIGLFDALGETSLSDFFKAGSNAISSGLGVAGGLKEMAGLFGDKSGIGKFLGKAGPWGAAIGAGLSVVTSLFAMHDAALQEEIEASKARQKEMQNLTKNLEKVLERTISGIYGMRADNDMMEGLDKYLSYYTLSQKYQKGLLGNIVQQKYGYVSDATVKAIREAKQTKTYYDATFASLLAQRDEVQHQLQLESDKKSEDEEKIADYKQALVELKDQIRYFATDMMKDLYDIDFKSWAQELSESLVDAWANGEDAAEAYRSKVSEILRDLGVKMIAERFVAEKLNPIMEQFIDQYEQDKGILTEDGMRILGGMYDAGDELQKKTTAFLDGLNEIAKQRGEDLKETEVASSGLSKGIQGVTETTADLLASYLNATRADVSLIALNIPVQNALAQSQVLQLESIARHTEAIERHTAAMENYLQNQEGIHRYVKGIAEGTYKVLV